MHGVHGVRGGLLCRERAAVCAATVEEDAGCGTLDEAGIFATGCGCAAGVHLLRIYGVCEGERALADEPAAIDLR